jgi:anti-anti-sigma regulatory factor
MSSRSVVKLDRNSGITIAEDLGRRLEESFQKGDPTSIDASEVERVDTTTVQLLYSFIQSMSELGMDVAIVQPSESFLAGAQRLGFTELFKLEGSK